MNPTFWTLPDFLIEEFPELRADIEEEYFFHAQYGKNPYPHSFLENELLPILRGERGELSAKRAGEILDNLLTSQDDDLAGAALTSVVEMLADEATIRSEVWPALGPTAREWVNRLVRDSEARKSRKDHEPKP